MVTINFWRCRSARSCAPFRRLRLSAAIVLSSLLALAFTAPLSAQSAVKGVPNALQGFSQNRDQPIKIEAAKLTMHDKTKEATFTGNVKVIQGDTTMTAKTLDVFYESKEARPRATMRSATPGPAGSSQIKRLVARGNVVVTQKDQRVSGDTATFETQTNQITMAGDVILTQTRCGNTLKGDRLKVDMTSGVSRVESDNRVLGIFNTGDTNCGTKGAAPAPQHGPAARPK